MKSTVALLALVAVIAPGSRAGAADDLLTRMASVNPDLRTYTATMHAEVARTGTSRSHRPRPFDVTG